MLTVLSCCRPAEDRRLSFNNTKNCRVEGNSYHQPLALGPPRPASPRTGPARPRPVPPRPVLPRPAQTRPGPAPRCPADLAARPGAPSVPPEQRGCPPQSCRLQREGEWWQWAVWVGYRTWSGIRVQNTPVFQLFLTVSN